MKEIRYSINDSKVWQEIIHKNTFSELKDSRLTLLEKSGEGTIDVVPIQDGLAITFIEVTLTESLKLIRKATAANDHFILNFYFSSIEIKEQIGDVVKSLGFTYYSIMLLSSMTESESVIPKNVPIQVFNITFSKKWLRQNVLGVEDHTLRRFFDKEGAIYLYESMGFKCSSILKEISQASDSSNRIALFANVLQLLTIFFRKVERRSVLDTTIRINPIDLENLLKIKEQIERNWQEKPSNEVLAKQAGMSLSKFKQLFKYVFGNSPYQYHLSFKMDKAMELLSQKEHSISDIGYIVGYSNLSQFSKIFKKTYNVLPSEVYHS